MDKTKHGPLRRGWHFCQSRGAVTTHYTSLCAETRTTYLDNSSRKLTRCHFDLALAKDENRHLIIWNKVGAGTTKTKQQQASDMLSSIVMMKKGWKQNQHPKNSFDTFAAVCESFRRHREVLRWGSVMTRYS